MNTETKLAALAEYLDADKDAIVDSDSGLFEYGRAEYWVLTDEEADNVARDEIENSLWAFRADFIRAHSKALAAGGNAAVKAFEEMQAKLSESAGPMVKAMIDDFDHFVEDAIRADGRGHFLSSYDGEEVELRTPEGILYVYRVN